MHSEGSIRSKRSKRKLFPQLGENLLPLGEEPHECEPRAPRVEVKEGKGSIREKEEKK